MTDLNSLAYPRHMHGADGSLIVKDAAEAADALANGYSLLPAGAEYAVPGAKELPEPKKADEPKKPEPAKGKK